VAAEADHTLVRGQQGGQNQEKRGLAGTVRSDHAGDLTGLGRKVHAAQGLGSAEPPPHSLDQDR
jgi:hypothetical protein